MDTINCICDLTKYSCDSYCCCDNECAAGVIQSWQSAGQCAAPKFTTYGLLFCEKRGKFFKENSEDDNLDPLYKLLCVQYNNAPDWGLYYKLITTSDTFSTDVISNLVTDETQYPDTIYFKHPTPDPGVLADGSPMRAVNAGGWMAYDGFWVLPTAGFDGSCSHGSAVRWLRNMSPQSCSVTGALSSTCLNQLNVASFTSLQISQNTSLTSDSRVSLTIKKRSVRTDTGDSALSITPTTLYSGTTCTNALVQADYRVYTNANQVSIKSIEVDIVVQNILSNDYIGVKQKVSVKFYTESDATELSGRPGYVQGLPLLTASGSGANIVSTNKTYVRGISTTGQCASNVQSEISPLLNYGEDSIFSCYKSLTLAQLQTYCTANSVNQEYIFTSTVFTYVTKFGDVKSTSNLDDWVQVNVTSPGNSSWNSTTITCVLPAVMVFDVIYTRVGPKQNPQDKIIYVDKYYSMDNWVFNNATAGTQYFPISLIVNYIPYFASDDPYALDLDETSLIVDDVVYIVRASKSLHLYILSVLIITI